MQDAGHPVINLGIGSPDLMPSQATIDALVESAQQKDSHGYPPYRGIAPFRQAIAQWYSKTYGVLLDPEAEILPLMGSKEGITHISLAFLDPGDEVLVPDLGYFTYRAATEIVGAKVRPYPLQEGNQWQPDWEKMAQEDYSRVKIMWANYPHMPTGAPASRALFEKLVAFAREWNILLCHDNPYSLILNTEKPLSILSIPGAKEVAVELNSMSKSHNMAGWRIGWISGAGEYLNAIVQLKSHVDSGMFLGHQKAAIEALKNTPEWHNSQNQLYKSRRRVAEKIVETLGCSYLPGQTGMFLWALLPEHLQPAEKLIDTLLHQQHVFLTPGFIFGEKGENYIRISLCSEEKQLNEALQRIKNAAISNL